MSYIGAKPQFVNFPMFTATGDGSTTTFTVSWTPGTPTAILVQLNGATQIATCSFSLVCIFKLVHDIQCFFGSQLLKVHLTFVLR